VKDGWEATFAVRSISFVIRGRNAMTEHHWKHPFVIGGYIGMGAQMLFALLLLVSCKGNER